MKITRTNKCPYCKSNNSIRVARSYWMRWIRDSRLNECNSCRREFLVIPLFFQNPKSEDLRTS